MERRSGKEAGVLHVFILLFICVFFLPYYSLESITQSMSETEIMGGGDVGEKGISAFT